MDLLLDFLLFRAFVSPYALIAFYWLGAVGMPAATWLLLVWLSRRFPGLRRIYDVGKQAAASVTRRRQRLMAIGAFVLAFLFMELMWRMIFEYLIAFLQMREALMQLRQGG